jgi:hypothetical protein
VTKIEKKFSNLGTRGKCYKNTTVNYRGNFNPTFSRVNMTLKSYIGFKNIIAILGLIMLYNIGYTNIAVIYRHSTVITKVMLLYNTE